MLATPAAGVPGVLKVWSMRVNSPGAEEARTTAGAGCGVVRGGADEAEAAGAGAAGGGPRSEARRSSSDFCATGWLTLPKAPVILSGSAEAGAFSPGAPEGVLESFIRPLPLESACVSGRQGYIGVCLTVK
jgi:hypothetical protein